MKIETWQDHGQLTEGQLVRDAEGKLWQVSKHSRGDSTETWLEQFSDEYAVTLHDGQPPADGDDAVFPLTVVKTVPADADTTLVDLRLTEHERRYLAVLIAEIVLKTHPGGGDVLFARWKQIADALHTHE